MSLGNAATENRGTETTTAQVLTALRRITRAIDIHSRSLAQRFGLTGPQLMLLKELLVGAPRTVGHLASAVHLSQATVTGIIDRLERKDLVRRARSEEDRRKVLVSLTNRAVAVIADAPPLLQEHFTDSFNRLSAAQQGQILASLQQIVALMEARNLDVPPILTTGPIDASPEAIERFLQPSP
jgi:DNA-binding MarR family transcriptional regulator